MATVHRLAVPRSPDSDSLLARVSHLAQLLMELGVAETRDLLVSAVIAVAAALVAGIALIASLVVLLAGAMAPLFDVAWQPFVIAGGFFFLLSVSTIGWSTWRLTSLDWPRETLTAFQENWRWLAAQLRSKLTLRSRAA